MSKPTRPMGVTILAELDALLGALLLLTAVAVLTLGPAMYEYLQTQTMISPQLFAGIMNFLGAGALIGALIAFLIASGLWMGMKWAWYLEFILTGIGLLTGILSLPGGLVGIVIDAVILWYFWQPRVKAYFGVTYAVEAPPAPPKPSTQVANAVYCNKCGTPNTPESKFCVKCGAELKTG